MEQPILLLGASTRAAAFSALRAGLDPFCIDLFGDQDLRQRCPTQTLSSPDYPAGFVLRSEEAPPAPWMYTGALENHPTLVQRLASRRRLWGNDAAVLATARSPENVHRLLTGAGLPCPAVASPAETESTPGPWLIKPRRGAGGQGIHPWRGEPIEPRRLLDFYRQEFIGGEPWAAIYLGDGQGARLLGVTRQLIGADWLHAAAFHYCGSIGPLPLTLALAQALGRVGDVLAHGCGLRGLFGIDGVLRDGVFWPVEVNPRYTASTEVLEYAADFSAVAWQRTVFDAPAPRPPAVVAEPSPRLVGKAILFAKAALKFPSAGPWLETLQVSRSVHELPAFADIPQAGQPIRAGRPILTFFAQGESVTLCLEALQQTARHLDQALFGG